MSWSELDRVDPATLVDARLQLHWAAQVVAAVGNTYLEKRADDSQSALTWLPERAALASEPTPGERPWRAALVPADAALHVLNADGVSVARLPVAGQTLDGATAWLGGAAEAELGAKLPSPPARTPHLPPAHAVADGAPFTGEPASHFVALARWYAVAAELLAPVAAAEPGASPVRCWPHHFDIATLITAVASEDPESSRTVGVGLSPGDDSYAEPYVYVTPWPAPEPARLPALRAGGHWHANGWVGAVLPAPTLTAMPSADRRAQARAFVASALTACRELLAP